MLLYDGVLTDQTLRYVHDMLQKYAQIVEVNGIDERFWNTWNAWRDDVAGNLVVRDVSIESGSSGETYISRRVLYGIVDVNEEGDHKFFFFVDKKEKELFIQHFSPLVEVIVKPFQQVINTQMRV